MAGSVDVPYPVVAITDVHGQAEPLRRLLDQLARLPEWPRCAVVFLGDYVDRGPDVRGTLDTVLGLMADHPGGVSAVMGNHDMALVRAARLDGGPFSRFWAERYRENYDHESTFQSYLGRKPKTARWDQELDALREAMPEPHRNFLAGLHWLVEARGHLFLHCGLSPELEATAEEQVRALRARRWDDALRPRPGTRTAELWQTQYPAWLGADKRLSEFPLPCPGRVQVSGHRPVKAPEVNPSRIRLDTSGGHGDPLTACLLADARATPRFIRSDGRRWKRLAS